MHSVIDSLLDSLIHWLIHWFMHSFISYYFMSSRCVVFHSFPLHSIPYHLSNQQVMSCQLMKMSFFITQYKFTSSIPSFSHSFNSCIQCFIDSLIRWFIDFVWLFYLNSFTGSFNHWFMGLIICFMDLATLSMIRGFTGSLVNLSIASFKWFPHLHCFTHSRVR